MQLENKKALITGASKGIGKATAIALSQNGVSVIVNYKDDTKSAKAVIKECNKYSGGNFAVKADITDEKEVLNIFKHVRSKYNKLEILINNAGIWDSSNNPNDLKVFNHIYEVNLQAQIRVTEQFLKYSKLGKIVNVSSIHGRLGHGSPEGIAYSSLKAAFDSYTKNLAKALAPDILVNGIAPGRTLTPQWGKMSGSEEKKFGAGQLINRFVTPNEVANAIIFLLKNDAMCGEVLTIDGGMSLKTLS